MKRTLADIELAFITCQREPNLLPDTLRSAFTGNTALTDLKRVRVFVDAPTVGNDGLRNQFPTILWLAQSEEQRQFGKANSLHRRASFNYRRALDLSDGARGLIVCEDDLEFRAGWLDHLIEALEEMGAKADSSILALYSMGNHSQPGGRFYLKFDGPFFGTQAMFFPAGVLSDLRDDIKARSVAGEMPYDLAIGQYVAPRQNLYATVRSLAQHVGYKTTGLAGFMHTSQSYSLPWPT